MNHLAIKVEGLYKEYRLGVIGNDTLREDLLSLWARLMGRNDRMFDPLHDGEVHTQRILALNNVTFDVHRGEAIGIIGENGAGKSTLLKILSRITTPTKGVVKMRGRVASLLELGTGFHPELTGKENIYLNGIILGMTKAEITRKFDDIVNFAGIRKFLDTPVKRYSSGMFVRLGFAVAAHLEPDILILDEVLSVGDAAFQQKCLEKLDEMRDQGTTIVLVSHNMSRITQFCSRAILLESGKLVEKGNPHAVVSAYARAESR